MRWLLVLLVITPYYLHAQKVQQKLPEKVRILFLLDGSGSMLAEWEEGARIDAAKLLLTELVDSLKVNQNLELALRVYGHLYSRQAQNCKDSKLEVGFAKNNHQRIIERLKQIRPKGTTPIAYSLEQAAKDFPDAPGYRNIVIIITDGIESCDGDPCNISLALQRKGIFLKPFIIGIGLSQDYSKNFDCIGGYYDANDQSSFRRALKEAVNTTLLRTTVSIEILNEFDEPKETNLNVSFIDNFTGVSAFDFVHYLDKNGRPDSVEVDPVLSYDIVVNTIPAAEKRAVRLTPGRHNVIKVKAPQGMLEIKQRGAESYPNGVKILIKKVSQDGIIHIQDINSSQQYLSGKYDLEVLTLPKVHFKKVTVSPSKVKTLSLPAPGILNLYNNASGYGSIYMLDKAGKQTWVYDLEHNQSNISLTLQPGEYKVVFRVDNAPGSKYTGIREFRINEGLSTQVRLFK